MGCRFLNNKQFCNIFVLPMLVDSIEFIAFMLVSIFVPISAVVSVISAQPATSLFSLVPWGWWLLWANAGSLGNDSGSCCKVDLLCENSNIQRSLFAKQKSAITTRTNTEPVTIPMILADMTSWWFDWSKRSGKRGSNRKKLKLIQTLKKVFIQSGFKLALTAVNTIKFRKKTT